MFRTRVIVGLAALSLLAPRALHATSAGTEGASFLDIPVGAGPAALGSAYSALATDAYAPVWNPAGLARLSSAEASGQHLSYIESIHYEYGSAVFPLGPNRGIGGAIQYLGTGDISATGTSGEPLGTYSSYYLAGTLAYGQQILPKLSAGLGARWVNAKLSDVSADAFAGDLGLLYEAMPRWTLAAVVKNLGSSLKFADQPDALPTAYHLSSAASLPFHLLWSVEGVYHRTHEADLRTGLEWQPVSLLSLRAGYRTDAQRELSSLAGFSTGIGLNVWGQEFSYAWLPYGDLGDTQYFSLVLRFTNPDKAKRNLIRYQSVKRPRMDGTLVDVEAEELNALLAQSQTDVVNSNQQGPLQ